MPIEVTCGACGATAKMPDEFGGQAVQCPSCESLIQPAAAPSPAAPQYYCEWEDPELGFFTRYFKTWYRSIFHPDDFFAKLPRDTGHKPATRYAFVANLIQWTLGLAVTVVVAMFMPFIIQQMELPEVPPWADWLGWIMVGIVLFFGLLLYPLTLLGLHLFTIVVHWSGVLCGGKGNYTDSYRMVGYSWGAVLLSLIPSIGGVAYLVAKILMLTYGFKHLHRVSTARAITAFLLPGIALVLILFGTFALMMIVLLTQVQQ